MATFLCRRHPRPKKVPKRFKKAHERFHARGNKPKTCKPRSAAVKENLRLARAVRKQTGRFVTKTLFEQSMRG
ncbi:hypothetical protein A3G55_03275 [Candidatus Giovannonibacteria bacterium RIFCSPLOWO2_12_FULL_44_25]|uniref:Uncharacterized protein n=3 Tax=Parcubacteria group TaxID=1794811 RepID=A0A837ING8_9BACT|nr:MAG: hypothetical protein UW15_C0003G0027 [Parcubacteria group bacterium GW2011_GWC1_44_10]KKT60043.1 MAG: hypothetical protein UW53_C0004G0055 [Candidatus Giovannonibacteria bacterium GW2011_GWA1_44_25]KKU12893.1 MAG: hypothetical protein UX18_C0007G0003 [Candidatus Azambacteria bacterium GW2011_GWC2_45_7b]KKU30161.1 MAG: hypothetical protein UX43_C0002G0055 [Candidatus Giovannonibacteria bacterium GW2011_GWB1_46_20]OGF49745.1 MAG: hypothetical protein A2120_00345 [Candidatus Giovannonibact